jgi:hypothetical protein
MRQHQRTPRPRALRPRLEAELVAAHDLRVGGHLDRLLGFLRRDREGGQDAPVERDLDGQLAASG